MRSLIQCGLFSLALALLPSPAKAAETNAKTATGGIDHEKQYRACIALTYREPWQAFETAETWAGLDGGAPARHCAAMALLEAKAYDRANEMVYNMAVTSLPFVFAHTKEVRPAPSQLSAGDIHVTDFFWK